MQTIIKAYKYKYINNKLQNIINNIVYKLCGECIIYLQKLLDTITDEDRNDIFNKQNATYCGNKFLIIKIKHKINKTELNEYIDPYYPNQKYIKNTIIENAECNNKISYFLNKKLAIYSKLPKNYTGHYVKYDSLGKKTMECDYDCGFKEGHYILYEENEHIIMERDYIHDEIAIKKKLITCIYDASIKAYNCTYITDLMVPMPSYNDQIKNNNFLFLYQNILTIQNGQACLRYAS